MKTIPSKLKQLLAVILCVLTLSGLQAQYPGGGAPAGGRPGGGPGMGMNNGRFYGKVVDDAGKGVAYATVSLYGMKMNTETKQLENTLIDGQITDDRGDFALENLPIFGEFDLIISYIGFSDINKKVSFGLKRPDGQSQGGFSIPQGTNLDVDLGNITLVTSTEVLDEVVVTERKSNVVLALDKKVFRVDQDATAAGGTAEDALKNVPSLTVDLDGNLNLRNGSPQLFIDGRPTTLTLAQIPSDAIETVEVITNPSSKYDASGGQAGIVNIVLKKNKKLGYNGTVNAGFDTQKSVNAGANINVSEGKVNFFANAFYNARRGQNFGVTERTNLFETPNTFVKQVNEGDRGGSFLNGRVGLDWLYDNRNTITFQASAVRGSFDNPSYLNVRTDTLVSGRTAFSEYDRVSESSRIFKNYGLSVLYKHLYVKSGRELTADINYNIISFDNFGEFTNTYQQTNFITKQRQDGTGGTGVWTFQSDYIDPLTPTVKLEAGIRGQLRTVDNNNYNYNQIGDNWVRIPRFTDEYIFDDIVYAAYANVSKSTDKWGIQAGLRAESSFYNGTLADGQTFSNKFPISLFPTLFVTRKINELDDLQLSVSRRVNRPNFFQLLPFTDYSDSLNLSMGNPNLVPEFTNSVEFSYQNIINDNHNFLMTAYYKQANNLITGFQFTETNPDNGQTYVVSTFQNSNSSKAYGLEVTVRNRFGKNVDFSTNANFYNSVVDANNIQEGLVNEQFTYFIKENINLSLPKDFKVQLSGQYRSKTAFTPSSGESRRGGGGFGGGFGGGNSAQGYTTPVWWADLAVSKSFMKRALNVTLSVQDLFRTRIFGSYSETPLFVQTSERWSNFQVVRLTVSYRFGKADASLFKRKNAGENNAGSDMMGG